MAQILSPLLGNGQNGDLVVSSTVSDSVIDATCTGTISTTSLSATNASFAAGQLILIHQSYGTGAGQWELNRIASYSAGTITTQIPLTYGYVTGAQVYVVKEYKSINIQSGGILVTKNWDGSVGGIIFYVCQGKITIDGGVQSTGVAGVGSSPSNNNVTVQGGFRGGGGWRSSSQAAIDGDGTVQLRSQSNGGAIGNAGGGGESSGGDSGGGGGGNGTAGGDGQSNSGTGGNGGTTAGSADLTTMVFGGGGGGGRTDDSEGGHGGSGGGIVAFYGKEIVVNPSTGQIHAYGGPGYSVMQACGGGGAGGSILLKARKISIGTNRLNVDGGVGGSTGGSQGGGTGGVGRIRLEAGEISGSTSPAFSQLLGGGLLAGQLGPSN